MKKEKPFWKSLWGVLCVLPLHFKRKCSEFTDEMFFLLVWSEISLLMDEVEGFCWSDTAFHGTGVSSGVHGWILARLGCSECGRLWGWYCKNIWDTLKSLFSCQHICCDFVVLWGVRRHKYTLLSQQCTGSMCSTPISWGTGEEIFYSSCFSTWSPFLRQLQLWG